MKRLLRGLWGSLGVPLIALALAFAIGALLIAARGSRVSEAYAALFQGAFGDVDSLGTTINKSTPLLLTGLAICVGYRGGVFNIGAEGQVVLGGMAATAVGVHVANTHYLLPFSLLAGMLAGALWSLLPGILRVWRGFNEVITTLMMNYIAVQLLAWSVRADAVARPGWNLLAYIPLKEPGQPFPRSALIPEAGRLPILWTAARMDAGIVCALLATLLVYVLLARTTAGFALQAVGYNQRAARYAGYPVRRTMLATMLLSGTLAGLAGAVEILGHQYRIIDDFLLGGGYDGIPVALIGQLHPLGVLFTSLIFGALRSGANTMQIIADVPVSLVYILQALAILFSLVGLAVGARRQRQAPELAIQTEAGGP
jgi:ABC-type uncharacterized transport system permease subunit